MINRLIAKITVRVITKKLIISKGLADMKGRSVHSCVFLCCNPHQLLIFSQLKNFELNKAPFSPGEAL